jgi:hypothetical protein
MLHDVQHDRWVEMQKIWRKSAKLYNISTFQLYNIPTPHSGLKTFSPNLLKIKK